MPPKPARTQMSRAQISRDGDTADRITTLLRDDIIRGAMPPGALLYQEELAARFQTSRMPVREGLKRLAQEGLVLLPANKTAQVAPLDPAAFSEVNEMRAVAEGLALRHAIPELSNRQIDRAEALQDQAEAAGLAQFAQLNRDFHMALLAPCGRPRLLAHIASLNDLSQRYFQIVATQLDYAAPSHAEHRDLLAACRARDVDTACALLDRHIMTANEQMLARQNA